MWFKMGAASPPESVDTLALAGGFTWLEGLPLHQRVASSIPRQGTYRGCGFSPELGHIREATGQCFCVTSDVPLSFSLNPHPPLN